ncbi:type III ribulose-bisphosphate carboxylase [Candidatus Woesearchaeota archaeon]|nr:type III ribulose-bisphosphate carboxylase [Candidatus Woesearchaeota archaeon]
MLEYIDTGYRPGTDEIVAKYRVTPQRGIGFRQACEQIAAESSIGTWTTISTMSPELSERLKPHVFSVDDQSRLIEIAYHPDLFELDSIPEILSSIAGNIFGMKLLSGLRLEDIHFPKRVLRRFEGPRYGIAGIRKLLHVKERPLVGTIVKPKVGLSASQHAQVAYEAWAGGLDIVKDDENLTNQPFNTFKDRIPKTLELRDRAQDETGERKIYMPNITAETEEMLRRAEYVQQHGGEYVMVDILTAGWAALQTVRKHVPQVIHAHRAMHGALTRNKDHGISMLTIAKLARLVGVDQIHIGTVVGKMEGTAAEVTEIEHEMEDALIQPAGKKGHALEQEWGHIKPCFAVASGGLHPGHVHKMLPILGTNIIAQFGGGCHGHPDGTRAGAKAIRQAVDAYLNRVRPETYAETHMELKKALMKWGA